MAMIWRFSKNRRLAEQAVRCAQGAVRSLAEAMALVDRLNDRVDELQRQLADSAVAPRPEPHTLQYDAQIRYELLDASTATKQ